MEIKPAAEAAAGRQRAGITLCLQEGHIVTETDAGI